MYVLYYSTALAIALLCIVWGTDAFSSDPGWLGLGIYVSTCGVKLWTDFYRACTDTDPRVGAVLRNTNRVARFVFTLSGGNILRFGKGVAPISRGSCFVG